MAVLTVAKLLVIEDALAAAMLGAKGSSTNGIGDNTIEEPSDDIGARGRLGDLNATVMGYSEDDYLSFAVALKDAIAAGGYQTWVSRVLATPYRALNAMCVAAGLTGVTSLSGFHAYYNTGAGGPWTCLSCPDFGRGAYYLINGAYMDAKNVYSPAIADMGHKLYNGSLVAGTDVDTDKYAGAAIAKATGSGISGTGLVTVVGNGRDATGATVVGRSWSVEVTSSAAFVLVPGVAGDILTKVTAINTPAGITAGTITVGCFIPAGRSNPPT